jgi:hypothetical protein
VIKDQFGSIAELIPLSLILFSLELPLLSVLVLLQRVYGD